MIPSGLERDAAHLRRLLQEHGFVRLLGHYDADGVSAAATLSLALEREGIAFQTRCIPQLTREMVEKEMLPPDAPLVIADMGSSSLDWLDGFTGRQVVTVDHHRPPPVKTKRVLQVNTYRYGVDGVTEASSSMLALAVAVSWSSENWDLIRPALAGAIGDKQIVGGPVGLNEHLISAAREKGLIEERVELNLEPGPLTESVAYSIDPHIPLLFEKDDVAAMLASIGIPQDATLHSLDASEQRRLTSMILLSLMEASVEPAAVRNAVRRRYVYTDGTYADWLMRLIDSSGRRGRTDTALALACGGRRALNSAESIAREFRESVHTSLGTLRERGVSMMDHIQHFTNDDPALTGTLGEVMLLYVSDHDRPIFGSAPVGNTGMLKVSARATRRLVAGGIDVGEVCRSAAGRCGGVGGGHSVAAGASLPEGRWMEFLTYADDIVSSQMKTG